MEPSGVPSTSGHSAHVAQLGWSFQPSTGAQVSPESSERNRPCGEPPAYREPGSSAWPGVSQNTLSTARASGSPGWNCGGTDASVHDAPLSIDRNTVGPGCPVRAPARMTPG